MSPGFMSQGTGAHPLGAEWDLTCVLAFLSVGQRPQPLTSVCPHSGWATLTHALLSLSSLKQVGWRAPQE